jgi:hypothetical protein
MKVACGGQWSGHSAGLLKSISTMVMPPVANTSMILARTPNVIIGTQAVQRMPHPLAQDVAFERLLGPGHHVRQLDARGRDLPALPDAHEAYVAQNAMQPRPGCPGMAQLGQPHEGDDEVSWTASSASARFPSNPMAAA